MRPFNDRRVVRGSQPLVKILDPGPGKGLVLSALLAVPPPGRESRRRPIFAPEGLGTARHGVGARAVCRQSLLWGETFRLGGWLSEGFGVKGRRNWHLR